jgi:hypothetical protein
MVWDETLTVVLRCYHCRERFTVEDVAFDMVSGLSLVVSCPSCGARPFIAPRGSAEPNRLHGVVAFSDERERGECVRVLIRLKADWYDRLAARARRGSEAEWCLKCGAHRAWDGDYLLECDCGALVALASLAASSSCPDAIRAMRQAYLTAIRAA